MRGAGLAIPGMSHGREVIRGRPGTGRLPGGTAQGLRGTGQQIPGARHRIRRTGHRTPGTRHPVRRTGHRIPDTRHPIRGTGHQIRGTGHRIRSTRRPIRRTGHRFRGTRRPIRRAGHRTRGTRHPIRRAGHRTPSTRHPIRRTGHRMRDTRLPRPDTGVRQPETAVDQPGTPRAASDSGQPARRTARPVARRAAGRRVLGGPGWGRGPRRTRAEPNACRAVTRQAGRSGRCRIRGLAAPTATSDPHCCRLAARNRRAVRRRQGRSPANSSPVRRLRPVTRVLRCRPARRRAGQ